jgi:hypothetical protein
LVTKTTWLITKHVNTTCGQNVEFFNVKPNHWALKGKPQPHTQLSGQLHTPLILPSQTNGDLIGQKVVYTVFENIRFVYSLLTLLTTQTA